MFFALSYRSHTSVSQFNLCLCTCSFHVLNGESWLQLSTLNIYNGYSNLEIDCASTKGGVGKLDTVHDTHSSLSILGHFGQVCKLFTHQPSARAQSSWQHCGSALQVCWHTWAENEPLTLHSEPHLPVVYQFGVDKQLV